MTSSVVCIVVRDYSRVIDNIDDVWSRNAVTINRTIRYISVRNEAPVVVRYPIIIIKRYAETHSGHQWSPAIITASTSPRYPSRSPNIVWYPHPSVKIIVEPAAIMKRRPAPRIIRYPRVAVLCRDPVTTGSIRNETSVNARHPDITILIMVYPCTIWLQLIIKHLE